MFSQQGNKYAYYAPIDGLDIFDFDRCTGEFSNQVHIDFNDSAFCGGVAFSPSGKYLYVSSSYYMYQFDVSSANILNSQYTVAAWDSFYSPQPPFATLYYLSHLAPDGKIYVNCPNSTEEIHVINYPDSAEASCGFCQHCISLPAFNGFTIPNHPNYFLGAETGSLCDTVSNGIATVNSAIHPFTVFPNPTHGDLYIIQNKSGAIKQINIYNSCGEEIKLNTDLINNGEYLQVLTSSFATGIYFLKIITEDKIINSRFVKE